MALTELNFILIVSKSTTKIRSMKLREENKLGSMQNYKIFERAQRDDRIRTIPETEKFKETCCSEAERTQGLRAE